jgi:hypothetical protein
MSAGASGRQGRTAGEACGSITFTSEALTALCCSTRSRCRCCRCGPLLTTVMMAVSTLNNFSSLDVSGRNPYTDPFPVHMIATVQMQLNAQPS